MRKIAAVLLDVDGVLVDSAPLHLRATQLALGERGPSYTERDSRAFAGATDPEVFRILGIVFDLEASTDQLVQRKREHMTALVRVEGRPLAGVPEMPMRLREAGLRLGIVSAAGRPVIDAMLAAVGLRHAVDAVVSGDEAPRGKPAPDGLLMGARRLGVPPEACLVVDDSRAGVLAARAAGMTSAAVPSPSTGQEDLSLADLILPSLEGLAKALDLNGHDPFAGPRPWERHR
jgi:HAD superfamily hydrolase (TIGR01509 family)